jgi:hypothetical protein
VNAINPILPGITTAAEAASLQVARGLRAQGGACCQGVLFHNLLVHSFECPSHRLVPAAFRAKQGGAK